jgi:hypothetical protein
MSAETAARLLGVTASADRDEVERAFRACARREHPDRGGDAATFQRLVAARAALTESSARARKPLVVVHTQPAWRRLLEALVERVTGGSMEDRRVR